MSSKKKDLKIVYSLRWKNGPKHREDKDQTSIVAVYDIPSTTLNFSIFKSYLLKNSGIAKDNVKVTYIMDNGKKFPILSQTDFQVALYAFRRKARAGEMINLLLEHISDEPVRQNVRHSNDAGTQFDLVEPQSITSTCCNFEIPPEWFVCGLAQLKKDIKEEIAADVSAIIASALADFKSPFLNHPAPHHVVCPHRRSKPEKRLRKPYLTENAADAKDLIKTLKLENKLEKLERKASKCREKRFALLQGQKSEGPKSSDSEAGSSCRRSRSRDKDDHQKRKQPEEQRKHDEEPIMDGRPVKMQSAIPHMVGGEIYLHQWEVQNTGQAQWTPMTQIQYTWGSKKLVPMEKSIGVPLLKPGEKGTVSVRLHVPSQTGKYECYWHFTHNDQRFGQWLGLQLIVDPFDLKGHSSVLETTNDLDYNFAPPPAIPSPSKAIDVAGLPEWEKFVKWDAERSTEARKSPQQDKSSVKSLQQLVQEAAGDLQGVHLGSELYQKLDRLANEEESECSWSSEPESVDQKGEFVVVPVPKCFQLDSPSPPPAEAKPEDAPKNVPAKDNFDDNNNTESVSGMSSNSIKLRDEELDNIVVITVPKDDQVKEGFIYVHVDGQKVLIPKNILKSEVVSAAQELERSPSASNSVGVIIDSSNESSKKSPTPSTASRPEEVTTDSVRVGDAKVDQEQPLLDLQERSSYFEANNYLSHCSAAGSCFSEVNSRQERQNRLFIFPQDIPGYEVVYPVLDQPQAESDPVAEQRNPFTQQQPIPKPLFEPVPNFQQTPAPEPPRVHSQPPAEEEVRHPSAPQETPYAAEAAPQIHILPETLVNGAVNVASSAINTARSFMNRINPQVPNARATSQEVQREANMQALAEMGFWNRELNAVLLERFHDDLNRVVAELVQ